MSHVGAMIQVCAAFHRHLWRRFPRTLRRRALFAVANLLAPQIDRDLPFSAPIIVVGNFSTASGLGKSARLCHEALKALGLPIYGIDVGPSFMQSDDGMRFVFEDGRGVIGAGTLIVHVNAPLLSLALMAVSRKVVAEKRVVGYWAWELPSLPRDWIPGFSRVHEAWVPSRFTARAVAEAMPSLTVRVVPHPVTLRCAPIFSKSGKQIYHLRYSLSSTWHRASNAENPLGAVAAFRQAFGDDANAHLILKSVNADVYPEGAARLRHACSRSRNITLIDSVMSAADLAGGLYAQADVFLSLHRSEGFGLTIAEAMLAGIPVVATGWSGNTDFVNSDCGFPIGFDLVAARDPQGTYDFGEMRWAEPRNRRGGTRATSTSRKPGDVADAFS